jgi:hypothetical protein
VVPGACFTAGAPGVGPARINMDASNPQPSTIRNAGRRSGKQTSTEEVQL